LALVTFGREYEEHLIHDSKTRAFKFAAKLGKLMAVIDDACLNASCAIAVTFGQYIVYIPHNVKAF